MLKSIGGGKTFSLDDHCNVTLTLYRYLPFLRRLASCEYRLRLLLYS
jgi:hypothetical protein